MWTIAAQWFPFDFVRYFSRNGPFFWRAFETAFGSVNGRVIFNAFSCLHIAKSFDSAPWQCLTISLRHSWKCPQQKRCQWVQWVGQELFCFTETVFQFEQLERLLNYILVPCAPFLPTKRNLLILKSSLKVQQNWYPVLEFGFHLITKVIRCYKKYDLLLDTYRELYYLVQR